jgi:hypothetical protein
MAGRRSPPHEVTIPANAVTIQQTFPTASKHGLHASKQGGWGLQSPGYPQAPDGPVTKYPSVTPKNSHQPKNSPLTSVNARYLWVGLLNKITADLRKPPDRRLQLTRPATCSYRQRSG